MDINNGSMSYRLSDYDVWYKKCENCGYDTGKSSVAKDGNKTCWKCGNYVYRDFTNRALKKHLTPNLVNDMPKILKWKKRWRNKK